MGRDADLEETRRLVGLVRPDMIQIHAKGNPGWTTYPSKIGHTPPQLVKDVLAIWRDAARRDGYHFSAYYNIGRDGEIMQRRPEWNRMFPDGSPVDKALCYHSGVAEDYLWPMIREIMKLWNRQHRQPLSQHELDVVTTGVQTFGTHELKAGKHRLTIAIVGELDGGRTARSLAYLLSKFERVKIYFVSPPEVQMRQDILDHLDEHDVWYDLANDVAPLAGEVDVIYQTRIRPDRVNDRAALDRYTIDGRLLSRMKPDAMILHPLPRTVEIDKAVDEDPRALYFKQAANGLFIRMALLTLLWESE